MAEDPLDQLMSATLAIEGDEAKLRRPALPFAEISSQQAPAPPTAPEPPQWHASTTPPVYASVGMPSAMPEMLARYAGVSGAAQPAPPPRITDQALANGATASAYAFSNAATAPPEQQLRDGGLAVTPQLGRERVDYLWHDACAEDAILRAPSMKQDAANDLGDEWLAPTAGVANSSNDGAEIRAILLERQPTSIDELARLYEETLDRGADRLLCLVRGELTLSFEPIDAVRATLAVVTPFLADTRLKEAYDAAQEALRATGGLAPAIAASHKERLDEAMRAASRNSYPAMESLIERSLIEERAFSRRKVFGGSFVRGLLQPSNRSALPAHASGGVPVYVPDAGAESLPLMRSVPVRLIAEVRPTQDAVESHPLALRVVALGRVVDLGPRGR